MTQKTKARTKGKTPASKPAASKRRQAAPPKGKKKKAAPKKTAPKKSALKKTAPSKMNPAKKTSRPKSKAGPKAGPKAGKLKTATKRAATGALLKKKLAGQTRAKKTAARETAPPFSLALKEKALTTLRDMKAESLKIIDLVSKSALADFLIVATGRSTRQVKAMADQLIRTFETAGAKGVRAEGLPQADWVVVDGGDVVVHLLRPEVRDYYRLEDIWAAL